MSINKNNYEPFLIDYLDGKLNANEVLEVLLFLELNPKIKAEFEGIANIGIPKEDFTFDFSGLHKPAFHAVKKTYESLLIAKLENELTVEENEKLQQGFGLYLELKHEDLLFSQTTLVPDFSVVFPNKQQLKKGGLFIVHRNTLLRVAAVLLLMSVVGISVVRLNKSNTLLQTVAIQTPISANKPSSVYPQQITKPLPTINIEIEYSGQKNNQENSGNEMVSPIKISKNRPTQMAVLASKSINELKESVHTAIVPLTKSDARIAYQTPAALTQTNDFIELKTFIRNKLNKGTVQLENKTIAALADINKTAGISLKKDSTTGKVIHFEITALGLEWSQSK